jgi:hypothetical protein
MEPRNARSYVDGVYQRPAACTVETKDDKKDIHQLPSIPIIAPTDTQ